MARTDDDTWDLSSGVGATATAVAVSRAIADRAGLIDDPWAAPLVTAVGIEHFSAILSGTAPGDDSEMGRMAHGMAVRTRYFDDFLIAATSAGIRQVVILASGLDARGYRLPWPPDVVVFDADTIGRGPEVASDDFPGDGIRWIRRQEGIDTVVVNGEITWTADDGYIAGARAGAIATLDLGTVADLAEVRLNGALIGTLWQPPFRAEVTRHLRAGDNTLEVRVANRWINRIIGDESLSTEIRYQPEGKNKFTDGKIEALPAWLYDRTRLGERQRHSFTTWKHYEAKSPLVPSGLLGPVKIDWSAPAP